MSDRHQLTDDEERKLIAACREQGIDSFTIRQYVTGARAPEPRLASKIAAAVGRDPHELFGQVERAVNAPDDVHRR